MTNENWQSRTVGCDGKSLTDPCLTPEGRTRTMNTPATQSASQWATRWLDAVADGSNTMSQRKLSSIQARGGGLEAVKIIAEQKGVHLLLLEDDKGNELVAASTKPFKTIC